MPYVEIELDDFDTDDLIEELGKRYLDIEEQSQLLDMVKDSPDDAKKLKLFLSVMHQAPLWEWENLFNDHVPAKAGPNQIPLINI